MIKFHRRRRLSGRPTPVVWLGTTLLLLAGCTGRTVEESQEPKAKEVSRPVRVIIVDDAPLAGALQRQWSARTDSELELEQLAVAQLDEVRRLQADIIIYPSACLGTLAAGELIEAPADSWRKEVDDDQADVFYLQRDAEVRWGNAIYAYSFGSPQFVLMYRADLFQQLDIEPPATWKEYQDVVERLQRSELGDAAPDESQPWAAVGEPLGAGWAANILLARAASYATHPSQFSVLFDYATMEPLIAGPPFVKALEELVATNVYSSDDADQLTPEEARRRLYAGQFGMVLSWPSRVTTEGEDWELADGAEIGFAELPGSSTAYNFDEASWSQRREEEPVRVPLIGVAGRLGSVVQNARRPRDATQILALLTGKEWSERLSPLSASTTMFRESQTKTPGLWTDQVLTQQAAEQYAEVVLTSQNRPIQLSSIRIPGRRRYLTALDAAVAAARSGEQSPQEALAEAAKAWAAITEELGVDKQREAYTRSLGLEP